ncbi:mannose-6-phosphate isomerase, class I [Vibrio splendidus]|uniref:mannose-6-phosphate isomerase, class I n=1 Tax=Vibrio splendidus TaxID=29497 RepID=UPI000C867CDA|nr:mannose-6-phosphate isomerase, class I [Vibrio splendidus]
MIYKLTNIVQNYAWGSNRFLSERFNVENPNMLPQAELWMGAHPNGCSIVDTKPPMALDQLIKINPTKILGETQAEKSADLSFMMKILAIESPLSIQVHPNKKQAEIGYSKEHESKIAIDSASRNYRDANHKPELVFALTDYHAMNGFRQLDEIIGLFSFLDSEIISYYRNIFDANKSENGLADFFEAIMRLDGDDKKIAIQNLMSKCDEAILSANDELVKTFKLVKNLSQHYPYDIGLFSPLFLNIINLRPGDAMFLYAETPHAYLRGIGVEVMANSDNVLRAGLTNKHIDINELIQNTKFKSTDKNSILMPPKVNRQRRIYPVPVDDFKFDLFDVMVHDSVEVAVRSAEILLCTDGVLYINDSISLKKGQSVFVAADTNKYILTGQGQLARAYN